MRSLEEIWEEYWAKEGYTMDKVGPLPQSRKKRKRLERYFSWLAEEEETRATFIEGMKKILTRKSKE